MEAEDVELYTLIISKKKHALSVNTALVYGIVCLEEAPFVSYETKEAYENDWLDENGVEVYDAEDVKLKASEITIPMGVSGKNCVEKYSKFIKWLTTNGTLMKVNFPYIEKTLDNVRFVKADPETFVHKDFFTFNLTFKITTPEA